MRSFWSVKDCARFEYLKSNNRITLMLQLIMKITTLYKKGHHIECIKNATDHILYVCIRLGDVKVGYEV